MKDVHNQRFRMGWDSDILFSVSGNSYYAELYENNKKIPNWEKWKMLVMILIGAFIYRISSFNKFYLHPYSIMILSITTETLQWKLYIRHFKEFATEINGLNKLT